MIAILCIGETLFSTQPVDAQTGYNQTEYNPAGGFASNSQMAPMPSGNLMSPMMSQTGGTYNQGAISNSYGTYPYGIYSSGNGVNTPPQVAAYPQMQTGSPYPVSSYPSPGQIMLPSQMLLNGSMMMPNQPVYASQMTSYGYMPQIATPGPGYGTGMAMGYEGYPNYGQPYYYGQPNDAQSNYYGMNPEWMNAREMGAASQKNGKPSNQSGNGSKKKEGSPYALLRSPLLETTYQTAKLMSPFNAPDAPDRGIGHPLEDQSWLDRPYYFGIFGGWNSGSELVGGQIDQGSGSNGGGALGWNLNHYWGLEGRLYGASLNLEDISGNIPKAPDRSKRLTALDVSVHYYPFGEARWRPYFKLGIATMQENFTDNSGVGQKINTWGAPFGLGLKYWWSDRVSVYADVVNNVVFGKGMTKTHSDWALNFGVNFSFGTNARYSPTVYWPQTTSMPY
ncbi:MAG: porin family protein [Planctomycetaceae bacterium]|nr:porin family protein [Planctomycetaceae bacterium]